jgi:homoserine dehydrogenase
MTYIPGFPDPQMMGIAGMDVARKLVILARECGVEVELEDVTVESLVPPPLQLLPDTTSFLAALPQVLDRLTVVLSFFVIRVMQYQLKFLLSKSV